MQKLKLYKNPEGLRGRGAMTVQLWWLVQATLFRLSPQFLYGWRRCILRAFGAKIGKRVIIRPTVKVTYPWKLSIEDDVWIGDDVVLYTLDEIKIKRNSVVSQRSYICTGTHDYLAEDFAMVTLPVFLGEGVWLATDVFVAPGVKVGDNCVVGARSSVFKDLAPDYIYHGSPALPVKRRPFCASASS